MRKIFILSCLLLSHTALCEYLMSDGNGYIGEDGTYYTGDGTGGFFTSDGQQYMGDGNGGFLGPNGEVYFNDGSGNIFGPEG
ncbi:hypothetical protein [Succinatimonas hippei]|nr:hypothetical protein [Succinatimonas hippei]